MAAKDTLYEVFVRDIMQALLRAQGLETVAVEHDVQVSGISRSHQIDVYWEYRLGGIRHRVIINCKRYASAVKVTDVMTLAGVLHDMPGVRGLIVTTVGFQKGAIDYARTHQIGLKVIRPPECDDWEGRLREINVALQIDVPELMSCQVQFNLDWVKANLPGDPQSLCVSGSHDARSTRVRDLETGVACDMNELWNRAMRENTIETGSEGHGVLKWNDARFERAGAPSIKVDAIAFRWRVIPGPRENLSFRSEPAAIVRDAIAGTLLFIDTDGTVSGDVEEELGQKP